MKKSFLILFFALFGLVPCVFSGVQDSGLHRLIFFYSPGCHKCLEVENEMMPAIEKEFKSRFSIEYRDITEMENYKFLLALREKYRPDLKLVTPLFFMEGRFLLAKEISGQSIREFISHALSGQLRREALPKIELFAYFRAFTPLAIISAGLIDGINPCAFTVIVFFISFLALQGFRRRELAAIGLSFISAVFLTYILIGLGLFEFLYKLDAFWPAARAINIGIGIFSLILGVLALYDYFKFKITGRTEGLVLQLPGVLKYRIQRIIGEHYRKTGQGQNSSRSNIFRLTLSAFICGFLISLLEAVCTGQTYLPTISFILKVQPLQMRALGYLLLYNLMFIIPLLVIFFFALLGVTSEEFSRFLKKNLLTVKILMAGLFFALGIFLLWRA